MALTLEEMEREAYQRGDVEREKLLALAADRQDPEEVKFDSMDSLMWIAEEIAAWK